MSLEHPDTEPSIRRGPATNRVGHLKQLQRFALSSVRDGVITADAKCRISFMNTAAESLTGWTIGAAKGQLIDRVFKVVNQENREPLENPALQAMREGESFGLAGQAALLTKDGREVSIEGNGVPIRTEAGESLGAVLIFRDITERRQAEEALDLLAGIVGSSEDAIVSKNLDGIVTSWNAAAERMFGYAAAQMIGQPMTVIIPPERRDEETMILSRLRRGERIEHFETERITRDGRRVTISLTVSPVRDRRGKIIGASKIARDISDRVRSDAERARLLASEHAARERAEAASRAKDEFVAMISHEIRSPLNAILGWAQTLQQTPLDTTVTSRALESIERNARTQVQLLADLLDVSRAITGKLRLETRPVDLSRSLEAALESTRPATKAKSITVEVHSDLHGALVTGDADRLQQIFWNLLSNAVKFTPTNGRVVVNMQQLHSHIEVSVRDSGIGIPGDFLPYVFERFTQANTSSTRRYGGLGLGLAIVRHLVELHGGSISAASPGEAQGTTFTMRLPVRAIREDLMREPCTEPPLSSEELAGRMALNGLRVMIVDDERETRDLLTTVLQARGAEVKACASSTEAIAAIHDWKPAVLVSDIGMPDEDGYSFMTKVRKLSSEQRSVPAVALTAYARAEDRMRALAAGFQMHVPKPVEIAELLLAVASLGRRDPNLV